jgi:hypothetical protein
MYAGSLVNLVTAHWLTWPFEAVRMHGVLITMLAGLHSVSCVDLIYQLSLRYIFIFCQNISRKVHWYVCMYIGTKITDNTRSQTTMTQYLKKISYIHVKIP